MVSRRHHDIVVTKIDLVVNMKIVSTPLHKLFFEFHQICQRKIFWASEETFVDLRAGMRTAPLYPLVVSLASARGKEGKEFLC